VSQAIGHQAAAPWARSSRFIRAASSESALQGGVKVASDFTRWALVDSHRRHTGRGASFTEDMRADATHTESAHSVFWRTPKGFGETHCVKCKAGWTRRSKDSTGLVVCPLDREPILTDIGLRQVRAARRGRTGRQRGVQPWPPRGL